MSSTNHTRTEEVTPEDELWQVETKTQDDGTVLGEIEDWTKDESHDGPTVTVEVRLPNGERFSEVMDWPGANDPREFKFVRVVTESGYTLSSAQQIVGSEIPCRRVDGDWRIEVPRTVSIRERARTILTAIFLPAVLVWAWKKCLDEDQKVSDTVDFVFISAILILAWSCAALFAVYITTGSLDVIEVIL